MIHPSPSSVGRQILTRNVIQNMKTKHLRLQHRMKQADSLRIKLQTGLNQLTLAVTTCTEARVIVSQYRQEKVEIIMLSHLARMINRMKMTRLNDQMNYYDIL